MYARIYIDLINVVRQTSDDDRDEVYVLVTGQSQFGPIGIVRKPSTDGYFGLHVGESVHDIATLVPALATVPHFRMRTTLWEGWIDYGKFVSLAVVVREQDGIPFISLLSAPFSIVGNILTGQIGTAIAEVGDLLTAVIQQAAADHHDTVGGLSLVVKNTNNNVSFDWGASPTLSTLQKGQGSSSAEFNCFGSGADYLVRVAVQNWNQINAKHSGKVLDVEGLSMNGGAPVQQISWNGGDNQLWEIVPVEGSWVRIVAKHSGQCLDVADASVNDGADVNQYPWHGGHNQQWKIEPQQDGYSRIVNRNSGKCLDIRGIEMRNHARVQQYTFNGGDNQLWRIW